MQAPLCAHSSLQDADPTEHGYGHLSEKHVGILRSILGSQLPHSTYHTYQRKKTELLNTNFYEIAKKRIHKDTDFIMKKSLKNKWITKRKGKFKKDTEDFK